MSRLGKFLFFFSIVSFFSFLITRLLLGDWIPFLWLALALFVGFFAGGLYVERRGLKEFFAMKTTKQGMSMGAMTGLVLIFLIAVNVLGTRKYTTWDLSLAKVNTLSDQSVKLVKSLTDDLRVIYFYKGGVDGVEQNRRMFIDLIRRYQDQSDRIKLEFVDVNERPDLTEKYNVKKGTQAVLLEYKGRTNLIERIDEQELTSAIVKVTREKEKKVFLLAGHSELTPEVSQDGQSISLLKQLLEGNRYTVQTFSLTTAPAIPADADVVIIPGPKQSFIDVEIRALSDYLKRGGSLILALKPKTPHHLEKFLGDLGVTLQNNFIATVLETPMGRAVDPRLARGSEFSTANQITAPFGKSQFTIFHLPQGLNKGAAPKGVSLSDLVSTNQSAMGFKDLDFKAEGQKGPFLLGVEVKGTYPGSVEGAKPFELLVFGDSDFLDDQYLYQNLNRDLMLNAVSALAKEENLISVTPKEVLATKLDLPETSFLLFIFGFIIPLPLLLFGLSGFLWYRRRNA